MKNIAITVLALCYFPCLTLAQDEQSEESGYYSFQSAEVLTRFKKQLLPIHSTDEKGIYIQNGKKLKRVSWDSPCSAQPRITVSAKLIAIKELSYEFIYLKDASLEEDAYDAMQLKERQAMIAIGQVGFGTPTAANLETIAAIEAERDEYQQEMETSIQDDRFIQEGHGDSINLSMTLTPTADIKDSYCAVMADYERLDGQRRVVVKVNRLGDLLKDIPEQVKFALYLAEGNYKRSRVELFFFSGDASPVPTNLSRGLKMLSREELEQRFKAQGISLPQKPAAQ